MDSVEPSQLTEIIRRAALDAGAVEAGVADLSPYLGASTPECLRAIAFAMRYPDHAVDKLPDDAELQRALSVLASDMQRIYSSIKEALRDTCGAARCCRIDAVGAVFGELPLSQKAVAVLAGLGWIGKSSLLVTPRHGPRVRLGTLFTDAPLIPDTPCERNACGECQACREACPATAVTGDPIHYAGLHAFRINGESCLRRLCRNQDRLGRREFCGLCLRACPWGQQQ